MKDKVKEVLDILKELPQDIAVRSAIVKGEKFFNSLNTIVIIPKKVKKTEVKVEKSLFGNKKNK
jgi:hypothetical protein